MRLAAVVPGATGYSQSVQEQFFADKREVPSRPIFRMPPSLAPRKPWTDVTGRPYLPGPQSRVRACFLEKRFVSTYQCEGSWPTVPVGFSGVWRSLSSCLGRAGSARHEADSGESGREQKARAASTLDCIAWQRGVSGAAGRQYSIVGAPVS